MSMLTKGIKKVRKAIHLPAFTLKNVATKYAPVALTAASLGGYGPLAGLGAKIGSAASSLPGASKIGAGVQAVRRALPTSSGPINPNDPNIGNASVNMGGGHDWLGIAEGGLAGLSALNSARASGRAGKYQDQALAQAQERWAEGAPLRAQGRARLLNPVTPDLTSTYNDPTNAFSAPVTSAPAALPRRRLLATPRG